MSVLNNCRTILSPEEYFSCEDDNVDLHMYYIVNMSVVSYFGTQLPEIEKIDGQMKIELGSESGDQKTISQSQMHYYLKTP